MTIIVKLKGGKHACIETPMVVFQIENRTYPLCELPDTILASRIVQVHGDGWIKSFQTMGE